MNKTLTTEKYKLYFSIKSATYHIMIYIFIIFPFFCYAQTNLIMKQQNKVAPLKIDLEAAMKMAILHSYELKSAKAKLSASQYEEKSAFRSLAPSLTANANLSWSEGNQDASTLVFPQGSPNTSSSATLTLTQPIIGIIPLIHSLNQKEITTKINSTLVEQSKSQSALLGATYYLNTQLAKEQLLIAEATLATVKKSKDDAEVLYQTGSIYKDDFLRIVLQYSEAEQSINNAKSQLSIAKFSLAQVIGINDPTNLDIDPNDSSSWELKNPKIPNLEEAKKIALKNNYSINIAKDNVKIAEVNKKINFDNYFPTLNAFISYTKNINPPLSSSTSGSLSNYDNYVTYGFQLTWTLWDWGVRSAQNASLTEQIASQSYLEQSQKEQTLNQVTQQYNLIQNNLSAVSLAKNSVQTAEEAYKLVSFRFLNGQVSALDLVTSQQSLTLAKASLAQARFNLDLAWISFQTILGMNPNLQRS